MGTLNIREYEVLGGGGLRNDSRVEMQIAQEPAVTGQQVTTSGTSAQSAALNSKTKYVRLETNVDIYLEFGTNPTAASTSALKMYATDVEYFAVNPGASIIIAAINA